MWYFGNEPSCRSLCLIEILGILIPDGNKSGIKSPVDFHGLFSSSRSGKAPVSSFLVAGGMKLD